LIFAFLGGDYFSKKYNRKTRKSKTENASSDFRKKKSTIFLSLKYKFFYKKTNNLFCCMQKTYNISQMLSRLKVTAKISKRVKSKIGFWKTKSGK
jgi:hypothetical protein